MLRRFKAWWIGFRFRQSVLELLVSLCLAFLVWLYAYNRARTTLEHVQVPVQIQLAPTLRDQYTLEVQGQSRVIASFTGPNSRIRELRRKLQRGVVRASVTLSVPVEKQAEASYGDTVRIDPPALSIPPGIQVELSEQGRSIPVTVHRLAERVLPVRLDFTGEARVSQIKIEPATVRVRGPKAVLERATFVPTQPYTVQIDPEQPTPVPMHRDKVALVSELDGRPIQVNPGVVQFRCRVAPRQKVYQLADVPIHFLCPPNFPYRPRFLGGQSGKVTVRVIGPASEEPPTVLAFVDLTGGSGARGRNVEPLRLQLPKDFQLVQPTNAVVAFQLDELDRMTTTSRPKSE